MRTWQPGEIHHVRITNDAPIGYLAKVEIDGVEDNTITEVTVHMVADGITVVTLTMLATVEVDLPAELHDADEVPDP